MEKHCFIWFKIENCSKEQNRHGKEIKEPKGSDSVSLACMTNLEYFPVFQALILSLF